MVERERENRHRIEKWECFGEVVFSGGGVGRSVVRYTQNQTCRHVDVDLDLNTCAVLIGDVVQVVHSLFGVVFINLTL